MNSTHKAEVIQLNKMPHPNADRLGIVYNQGYSLVINLEDWQGVDKACHILPDSLVNVKKPEFAHLDKSQGNEWYRVGVKKLRGIVSYGLLVKCPEHAKIGDDLAAELDVRHFEPNSEDNKEMVVTAPLYTVNYDVDAFLKHDFVFKEGEMINASEKIHGCLHQNTMITTPYGLIRMEDIEIGSEIISFNEKTGIFESDIVNDKIISGKSDNWIELIFDNNKRLVCTEDHRILTSNGYVEAINLTEKDEIIGF